MDLIDKKILNLLQADGRMSIKKMSGELFITAPAVSARIKHLEEQGIIGSYQARINVEAVGLPIQAFIQLAIEPAQKPEFYDYIQNIPNILECNCVTGTYSMLLKVAFPSTHLLDQFINTLQRFGSTNTQIVFSTPVETRGYTFIEE